MENNNDQKWKLADVLANFTKSQLQKQQEIAIREEMKQRMMDAQAQNLAQFVPGAQPAPQEEGFPQDFAMAKEGGIHIDPSKRGTFKAQATRMGMSVQEAARHILANKDKYSSKMVKKANFARNFAKEEGGEMLGMDSMGGDDDDRRWWQFWKKDKPMTFDDKMKQELGMLTKNLMEIEAAIMYYTQKGGVNQSSFDEGLNNYHNSYSNYIEQLKNTREKLLLEKGKVENALNNKTADDKRKEEEIAQMKYDEARIKADKEAAKRKAEEESYKKHRQDLKNQANQKAYGGQMNNAPQNSGFQALPDYVQKKILENMEYGGSYDLDEYKSGGYTVRRSTDRKGKTHVVIGPDGTKKYFGDPGMGERGKSKYGKEAFYKRHAQNLKDNPYFRAYARATWEEGGEIENEDYENEENENEDYEMVSGIADILQQVRDKENRKQIAENMIKDFEEEDVDYNLQKFMDMAKLKRGGEMIRRADGSYSQRGFWDNIRANKGSGKAPTKEMLAQERKLKKKRYDDGGTLPSCEEGYYWNPDKQSCEPVSLNTDVQNNQEFLTKMANSPLFAERYARMTGSNNLEDAEKLRQNILTNIGSVKYKQTPRVEAKGNLGEYHPSGHIIKFSNPSATTLLHELSHASTKGHKNFSKDQVNNLKKRWNYDPYYGSNLIDEKFAHFNNVENASQPLKDFKDAYKTLSGMMFANSKSEKYLKTPTEVKAMLDVLRDKLQRKGLYDPVNEKFTEKNYNSLKEELLRNNGQGLLRTIFGENSQDNYELLQLLNNYSKEDVIDMFNSFVSNSPDTNQGYGKRGGQLGRFLL
jgi:hypothetical protein